MQHPLNNSGRLPELKDKCIMNGRIKSLEDRYMEFRLEKQEDYREVEKLTREAFWDVYAPGCSEHLVLHKLRESGAFIRELDYVAEADGRIVGNIAYSRVFNGEEMCSEMIAFGPVSVHPDYQRQGIGREMIAFTLKKAEELGYKAVMITGSPEYYRKFGFIPAAKYGIYLPSMKQEEENDYFMAKELKEGYLKDHAGIYTFDKCFYTEPEEVEAFDKKF